MAITVEEAVRELNSRVQDARNFISTEFEENWERAERYYNGETDLDEFDGRSKVVKTEVRDAIRNTMPSIMRVLLQSRKIVEYIPGNILSGGWAEQQSEYITQLFWASDGYRQLYSAIEDSAKLKYGALKAFWIPNPRPTYFYYTKVPGAFVEQVMTLNNVEIVEVIDREDDDAGMPFYDLRGYDHADNGKIVIEAVPNYEFFIDQNSTSVADAVERGVHGQCRQITVGEAEELGLEYDDWESLSTEDPEISLHSGSSDARRGYAQREAHKSKDPINYEFLLTEVYYACDLEDTGYKQLYRFWLGGSSYEYIDHEEVEDSPFEMVTLNLAGHTPFPLSVADITVPMQDAGTSLLRATIDNAHAANNPKFGGNPTLTNFDDLTSTALNAPVRTREQIQVIQTPFTGQGLMGLLGYLDQDVQEKVGVTKAAQGLDPDSLQSTDKQAVMNTISMSQGQVELMVRNLCETALIPLFRKMLRLASRHFSPKQVMKTKGKVIPVDLRHFDPDLVAVPNVGLGSANVLQKQQTLAFILQKQEEYMMKMGEDNPFTSLSKIYNTLEDLVELGGIHDVGRYFNIVTPKVEQQIAKMRAEQAKKQEENAPMDPSRAMMLIEAGKARIDRMKIETEREDSSRKRQLEAIKTKEELDLRRDNMIQERALKLLELGREDYQNQIREEQDSTDGPDISTARSPRSSGASNQEPRPQNGVPVQVSGTQGRSDGVGQRGRSGRPPSRTPNPE